jgi:hypothetical protein
MPPESLALSVPTHFNRLLKFSEGQSFAEEHCG